MRCTDQVPEAWPPSTGTRRTLIPLSLLVLLACSSESSNKTAKVADALVPDPDAPRSPRLKGRLYITLRPVLNTWGPFLR